jgi:hypothetical protein
MLFGYVEKSVTITMHRNPRCTKNSLLTF